jgi:type II secretory pathway component GspD/PulD (secretin)
MEVVDALAYLALRSGMNIVTSKNVTGRVTFQLKDVPLQDIFDVTLLSNNLAYEKRGEIIYVLSEQEYEGRHGKAFSDAREVKVFHLNYAIPTKAFDLLDTLKSKVGRILVDQETGTVLLMDTPDRIKEMEESLMILEQKNNTHIFNLQYAQAQTVEEKLKAQLDNKSVGSIWADERNNQVIVQTLPDRMDDVVRIIEALDQKTKEVLIDVKIVKIKLNNELTTGFEWEGMFQELTMGSFLGSHPLQPVERLGQSFIDDYTTIQPEDSNPPAGGKVNFGEKVYLGKVDGAYSFEALFKFLKTIGETRLLSNPKLAVINNQEARIHIGRKEAYVTTTTTTGQTTTTTAEDVTFVDVGIQLSVTPTINDQGYISLQIKPEISSVVDVLTTPSGNEIPIIDTSLAETTVLVKDSSTILIGGLRREEETEDSEGLPLFSHIPVLGNLFSSKKKTRERSELLVMITPRIVSGDILTSTGDIEMAQPDTKPYRDYNSFEIAEPEPGKLQLKPYRD